MSIGTAPTQTAKSSAGEPRNASDFDASAWIGREIDGRYRVIELIASGGMGAVLAVEHMRLRHRLALKILLPDFEDHAVIQERFEREALAMAQLDHPHIISALDFGELPDGTSYMVMPLVRGSSVHGLIEKHGALPWQSACLIAAQIADALAAAHADDIVHRDLKPDNVLITTEDDGSYRATILDFGIARVRSAGRETPAPERLRTLTRVGVVMGTPGYMAPEQGAGQAVTAAADLYALGVLLWEMISGRPLFDDVLDFTGILTQQLTVVAPAPMPPPGTDPIPDELGALLAQLLAARPDDRPASASLVRDRLREVAYAGTTRALAHGDRNEAASTQLHPVWRKRLFVALAGAVLFVFGSGVVGMGLGYALGSTEEHDDPELIAAEEAAVIEDVEAPAEVAAAAAGPVGAETPLVRQLLNSSSSSDRRAAARALLASGDELPAWVRAVAEYEGASGCTQRRTAVDGIVAVRHPSATAALERTVNASRRGCGTFGARDCYSCFRPAAERGLRTLQGLP
ncbi:MAG: serine/threonine protein kinase [Sandaracinaceae bacterium]|nr:serine/threonine protein kinase [Sandaracinaceae bacterium]